MSDSEDSLLEAEYAKVVEEVVEQLPSKKSVRTVWPKIERYQRVEGKQVVIHPFLSSSNEMDIMVVRHLIVDEPYLSKHGDVSKAWNDCVTNINAEDDNALGDHIFFPPLTTKRKKTRSANSLFLRRRWRRMRRRWRPIRRCLKRCTL